MVDPTDPLKLQLSSSERIFGGSVGAAVLVAAAFTTVFGAWQKWTVNSVAMGAMFAVGLVLLTIAIAGRLPSTLSVSGRGFAIGYSAGSQDTAKKAAQKNNQAATKAKAVLSSQNTAQDIRQANDTDSIKGVVESLTKQIADSLPTDPASFMPDAAEVARAITSH